MRAERPQPLPDSAIDAARAIRRGALTSEALTRACIAAIDRREAEIGAWSYFDRDQALRQARAADARRKRGGALGALHGVPVAVKDIIDTADMPTENGTVLHRGRRPAKDAFVVARLRSLGAVILGKTVTTEFAVAAAGKTANPHDPERTPGGSSSGSAAAIAAGMAPLALGTQTGASIIRPAAYCGVVGYKPSFGSIPRTGILTISPSLDHPGALARTVDDAAWLCDLLAGRDAGDPAPRPAGVARLRASLPKKAPRLVLLRTPAWNSVEPASQRTLLDFAAGLPVSVEERALPPAFERFAELFQAICGPETARSLAADAVRGEAQMSPLLRANLERGRAVSALAYLDAQAMIPKLRTQLAETLAGADAAITPAVTGRAPHRSVGTGNPICSLTWSLLGAPAISLPLLAVEGLPLGVQLVAPFGHDRALIAAARWLEHTCTRRP